MLKPLSSEVSSKKNWMILAGEAIHHRRQMHLIGFHLDRQAVQLVVGDRTVNSTAFSNFCTDTQALEEQPRVCPATRTALKRPGSERVLDRRSSMHSDTNCWMRVRIRPAQVLAVAEHFHRLRRRGVWCICREWFQRFQHRLFAAEMQGAHFVPRVAIQQIDAAHGHCCCWPKLNTSSLRKSKCTTDCGRRRSDRFRLTMIARWRISHGLYSAFGVGAGGRSGK